MRPLGRTLTLLGLVTSLGLTPVAAALTPATAAPAAKAKPKARTVSWHSGVFVGGNTTTGGVRAFASWRGRKVDVATIYAKRGSWNDIAHDTWTFRAFDGFPGRLAISLPLVPDDGSSSLADVAAGKADRYFRSFAQNLVAYHRGGSIIRLGWEFDGDWMKWAAWDPTAYKAAFRRVVGVIRSVAPGVSIDWCGNLGGSHTGHPDFTELYPGDDVVDIVGVDAYDRQWFPVKDEASWKHYRTMSYGLDAWPAFAKAHHKKVSVPEWGLYPSETGDAAFYIAKMHTWFKNHASILAYESYFNEPQSYIHNSLVGPDQNPQASRTYASLW
ncbi:MAG TPA: glycosyl hydrolase [Mycobacteriales bacterium]|nr:glycosyl hydrolase [Mycobacteriales bacterium]